MNADFTPWPEATAAQYRREGLWTGENLGGMLAKHADYQPENDAIVDTDGRLSYGELARRVAETAAHLCHLGIGVGDNVVMQSSNHRDYVIILFALFRLGAVPVCALPAQREAEIGFFCRQTEAVAYLYPDDAEHRRIATEVSGDVALTRSLPQVTTGHGHERATAPAPRGSDLALLQLSGGSTGVPKLIPRTHDDYLYSVRVAAQVCEIESTTRYLCALPAAHNFPLSSPGILGVLYAGGTVVMAPDPSPDTCFDLIDTAGVTMSALVPSLAKVWLAAARQRGWKPRQLRVLQVGGARIDSGDAAAIQPVLGARLQQVFGMAEGLVCYTRYDDSDEVVHNTQGLPASARDEIRIVDDIDIDVPDGKSGHLLTRGPYTVRGYFRADEHNANAFTNDGFYRTGDIVQRTPTGHLVVTGRAKDQINRGGEKIAAAEIEERLRTHPGIQDAAIIAVPDPQLGERSCAVCIARDLSPQQVRAYLRRQGVAAYKIPDLVRFTDRLPHTAIGKVDKKRLCRELLDTGAI